MHAHHATSPAARRDHHTEHGHDGHDKHAGHDPAMFRDRFWLSLVLTIPLVITSHMVMDWFGYTIEFPGMAWVGPVLGSVVFWWGGWPFLAGGAAEIRSRQPGMMLLITMAISVAYVSSMATSLDWLELDFWWELAALVTVMLLGHWQEMRAIGQAQGALAALAELLPDDAELVDGDSVRTIPLDDLTVGDVVLVRAGGRVPADGTVVDGAAEIDESMITGESRPVAKVAGDRVVAGTVSTDSSLRVRVDAVGDDTALAGIQRLVADAQASRSRAQALADRFAALLFWVALAAGVVTFVVWSAVGDTGDAVTRTVTVLVIACPHALGLAIPLVIALSTAVAAKAGILVKDRLALERMRTVDTVLFDKTGTLTKGAHVVTDQAATAGVDVDDALRLAAGVEADSEHPVARAIVAAGADRGGAATASDFRALPGRGVAATIDGRAYAVGGPALIRQRGLTVPDDLHEPITRWEQRGAAVLYLVRGDDVIAAVALEDEVRPEARDAVAELRRLGISVAMITGDAQQVADAVGRELGIDEVFAEVLPEDKDHAVVALQEQGRRVAMVGDGVNDAPALARADVGLAIGAGTDVALESAGVVLASSDPRGVAGVVQLSRASYRKMRQNLAWAAGYNVAAIPLAAGALAWAGITLSPAVGAVLMSLSTIVVALNAQLLRRLRLLPASTTPPEASIPPGGTMGVVEHGKVLGSPVARIGAYGLILVAVLGAGAAVGAAIGPEPSTPAGHDEHPATSAPASAPGQPAGLDATEDGYHLQLDTPTIDAGTASTVRFVIHAPDGTPLTTYDVAHEQELHLIVASRDLRSYAHVHPERAGDGTWTVEVPALPAGPYRLYADFVPSGGEGLTLGTELGVAGDYEPRPVPAAGDAVSIDGYDVTFDGELVAGEESELTVSVSRDGVPVDDLQPYLGALGHLVAIRDGDMAYLHVHPLDDADGPGGPAVRFAVDVPTAGTYGLFFDFSHGDAVRTASVVATSAGAADAATPTSTPAAPGGDEHGSHGS